MQSIFSIICVLFVFVTVCKSEKASRMLQYDELYSSGIQAYFDGDWKKCVDNLEESIKLYRYYNFILRECFNLCEDSATKIEKDIIIERAICGHNCEEKVFNQTMNTVKTFKEVKDAFKQRKPYTYLQYAYFKLGNIRKAVQATFTFNEYNQDNEEMKENLDYYKSRQDYEENMLVNLEETLMMESYKSGFRAYQLEDYESAKKFFTAALEEFYKEESLCRMKCDTLYDYGDEYPSDTIRQHEHINKYLRQILECSLVCPNEAASVSSKFAMINFLPELYNYLQFSSYKLGEISEAYKWAKSYLVFFPTDQVMIDNLKYYPVIDKVKPCEKAVKLKKRITLEASLLRYYYQTFGIKNFNQGLFEPFKNHEKEEDEIKDEVEEVKLDEDEEEVSESASADDKHFVDGKLGSYKSWKEKTDDIIDSRDISNERQRNFEAEKRNRENFEKKLNHLKDTVTDQTIGRIIIDSPDKTTIIDHSSLSDLPIKEADVPDASLVLLANSTQLGGANRVAFDGLLTDKECRTLMDLELVGGTFGDGYYGNMNPHTMKEKFQGLTLASAIKLAETGEVPLEAVKLYDDVSNRAIQATKSYFKLDKELFFDYTHLVCRTAIKDKEVKKSTIDTNLSHPIHGDNCILFGNGTCTKQPPAYTWRDYSAIVYLNDDFEGGEFIMTDSSALQVTLEVKPKCGRLMSFCAGKECLHGVKPITRGRRCAVALWFTHDPLHDERKQIKKHLFHTKFFASRDEL